MEADVYAAPESGLDRKSAAAPALWNPNACGLWSLLFTPVFGSFLVMKNWEAIGEEDRASTARVWFGLSIVMAIISLFGGLVGFIWLIIWYFASQKKQMKYVIATYGDNYPRRSWGKPVLIGLACLMVVWAALVAIFMTAAALL